MIGKDIEITKARNKSLIGIAGEVIRDTKHTFTIRTKEGDKTIIKEQIEAYNGKQQHIHAR